MLAMVVFLLCMAFIKKVVVVCAYSCTNVIYICVCDLQQFPIFFVGYHFLDALFAKFEILFYELYSPKCIRTLSA